MGPQSSSSSGESSGEWIGTREAARRLGIHPKTLTRRISASELPYRQHRRLGHRLYSAQDVAAYWQRHTVGGG